MRTGEATPQIALGAAQSARDAGLRYAKDSQPGIRRIGGPKRFCYVGADGRPVREERIVERIRRLAIPPAWVDVWICPYATGHLQATGRDVKNRKQYRYHRRWTESRNETKFERAVEFAEALPALRQRVRADLQQAGLPRTKVLATVAQLLQYTLIRVGNAEYARDNDSYGLTTLRSKHVRIEGETLRFRFRGKSGKDHVIDLRNRRLARIVRSCRDLPSSELFQYIDESGTVESIDSGDVNLYLRELTGETFSAKDFRTWGGTVIAAQVLHELGEASTAEEGAKRVVECIKRVAKQLGNTAAVCRKYYVNPVIVDCYLDGSLTEAIEGQSARSVRAVDGLSAVETAVLELLRRNRGSMRRVA